jgi:hypothetical protein
MGKPQEPPMPRLAHIVYFTLKEPTPAGIEALTAACRKYLCVQPGIEFFGAGPCVTELDRPVNDRDWHVGLHLVFASKQAHDDYQTDATHQIFIDENKQNWARVRVFDAYI